MIRNLYKYTLEERVQMLRDLARMRAAPQTNIERKRVKQFFNNIVVSLVVDGYKQTDDGDWYDPAKSGL